MTFLTHEDRRREMLAQEAATLLSLMAGWETQVSPLDLPPSVAAYACDPKLGLIVAPWRKHVGEQPLLHAARSTRLDILAVAPGRTESGAETVYMTLYLSRNGEVIRHPALRLWRDPDGAEPCMASHPDGCARDQVALKLEGSLQPGSVMPWRDIAHRDAGLALADRLWARTLSRRCV
jgi:hypothetical protein